jgi:hypothetical protein
MNTKKIDFVRNDNYRKLDIMKVRHKNVVKFSAANGFNHEITKAIICYELVKQGKEWVTEAVFPNGVRADIYVLDDDTVFEIETNIEKNKAFKEQHYPVKNVNVVRPANFEKFVGVKLD